MALILTKIEKLSGRKFAQLVVVIGLVDVQMWRWLRHCSMSFGSKISVFGAVREIIGGRIATLQRELFASSDWIISCV